MSVHRDIVENHIGRNLRSGYGGNAEHVHHADGNRGNNDLANLVICTPSEHTAMHARNKHRARVQLAVCRRKQGWGFTDADRAALAEEARRVALNCVNSMIEQIETALWHIKYRELV